MPASTRRESSLTGGTWKNEAIAPPERPRALRALAALAIVACPPLAVYHFVGVLAAVDVPGAGLALAGAALGFLAADLVTGLVHWACDTWGDERTRWVGPGLIAGFREHHRDPEAMLAHDWIEVNAEPAIAAALAFVVAALPPVQPLLAAHPFVYAGLVSLLASAALANQLHQWAHTSAPPAWVRALQRCGWLTPERHARHHRAPYTNAYCISSGLLNRPLDALGFWRGLENAVQRATGARPRRPSR